MLGSFLLSQREKSDTDKRCRANLPAVRLQGQVKDKTGLQIRLETPAAEPQAARRRSLDLIENERKRLCSSVAKSPRKLITLTPPCHHLQHLTFCLRALVGDWKQDLVEVYVSTDRDIILEKSTWQELAQLECINKTTVNVSSVFTVPLLFSAI